MSAESQPFYVIIKIWEFCVVIIVFLFFFIIVQSFIISEIDVSGVEPGLFAYNLVFSRALMSDGHSGGFSIGSKKLTSEALDSSMPGKSYIGAEVKVTGGARAYVAYYNKKFYERWLPQASSLAAGCALYDRRSLPVLLDNRFYPAEIGVVSEKEVSRCS